MNNKSTAINRFSGGLVMDFNPIITPDNVLTGCLNGTIFTNNGNENVLQNDMGNARVETAFLPEGYIPVGSCEFGDIIYIASYNPILDKCQLGCFPSPQRNITSDQISDLKQSLSPSEFQELNGDQPTGKIKQSTLKKIIYKNNLTAGDKYIICANEIDKENYLSDLGNTDHEFGGFPKLYKIKVISIEEDGKITDLSSGLKWYNYGNEGAPDYFMQNKDLSTDSNQAPDIDTWRTAVSSAYAIFTSKVSGKLALLIELEAITGFSCTWGIKPNDTTTSKKIAPKEGEVTNIILTKDYNIYWSINWETENNNVNPSGMILTDSKWVNNTPKYKDPNTKPGDDDKWIDITSEVPIAWNYGGSLSTENNNFWEITRGYKPETLNNPKVDYSEFKDFDKYLEDTVNVTSSKEISIKDISKIVNNPNYSGQKNTKYYAKEVDKEVLTYKKKDNSYQYLYGDTLATTFDLNDDIVNNYFKFPIRKDFYTFQLNSQYQDKNSKIQNLTMKDAIYQYTIAPCMPYGVLEEYSISGNIDFNKIGTESIELNTWKYYNTDNYITLTWGMEAYTEPGWKISETVIEFYDDLGFSGALHFNNKDSFNGVFTNYIVLNNSDPNLSNYGFNNTTEWNPLISDTKEHIRGDIEKAFLKSNFLYLAKICCKQSRQDDLGNEIDSKIEYFYRWMWTSKQFNNRYFEISDFKDIQPVLDLAVEAGYQGIQENWDWNVDYDTFKEDVRDQSSEKDDYNWDSTIFQTLNVAKDPENINFGTTYKETDKQNFIIKVKPRLLDTYNTFSFNLDSNNKIPFKLYLVEDDKESITYSPEQPAIKYSDKNTGVKDPLKPESTLDFIITPNNIKYKIKNYKDYINLRYSKPDTEVVEGETKNKEIDIEYIDSSTGESITKKATIISNEFTSEDWVDTDCILTAEIFNKYRFTTKFTTTNVPVIKSFITTIDDCLKYNLDPNKHWFNKVLCFGMTDTGGSGSQEQIIIYEIEYSELPGYTEGPSHTPTYFSKFTKYNNTFWDTKDLNGDKNRDWDILYKDEAKQAILDNFKFIFPFSFAHKDSGSISRVAFVDYFGVAKPVSGHFEFSEIEEKSIVSNDTVQYSAPLYGGVGCSSLQDKLLFSNLKNRDHNIDMVPDYGGSKSSFYNNSPILFGRLTYNLLTHCFYLTDYTEQQDIWNIDNYIYLENYLTIYKKDVVIETVFDNKKENSEEISKKATSYIILNNIDLEHGEKDRKQTLEAYKNRILDNILKLSDYDKESLDFKLQFNNIKQSFPIIFQIPSIQPLMYQDNNSKYIVRAYDSDIQSELQRLLDQHKYNIHPNTIYCFSYLSDQTTKQFMQLSEACLFKEEKYRDFDNSQWNWFNLNEQFISRLTKENNMLRLSNIYSFTGTYGVGLLNKNKDDDINNQIIYPKDPKYLTNFPKDIQIFQKVEDKNDTTSNSNNS